MSVIIRLQNLPWSANAADIRNYFSGLSIPEGGVHIIGGEQGDAFIAFSTDEDARQAMLKDNGKLKEVKIKLFLSSRTEMLRIIEQARQQAMKIHSLMHVPATPAIATAAPSSAVPQGGVKSGAVHDMKKEDDSIKVKDDDRTESSRRDKRDRSVSRDRSRGRDGDRSRDKSRGRSYRDRDRDRRRRDRSRSRSRTRSRDRYRSRRSRSRDRKRSSRDRDSKENSRSRTKDRNNDRQDFNEPKINNATNQSDWNHQQRFQAKLPDPPAIPQKLLQIHQNGKEMSPNQMQQHHHQQQQQQQQQQIMNFPEQDKRGFPFPNQMAPMVTPPFPPMPMRPRDSWPPMGMPPMMDPTQLAMQRGAVMPGSEMTMPGYPGFQPMFPTPGITDPAYEAMWRMAPPAMAPMEAMPQQEIAPTETSDLCVEIRGLPLNASYIDVKKLFDGLTIPSDGIKMINDTHGYRTGIAYVKFSNSNQKKSALNQHGKKVRSNIVEVIHLRDSIYKTAVDNFKPDKDVILNSVDMDIDNGDVNEDKWPANNANHIAKQMPVVEPDPPQISPSKLDPLAQRKPDYIRSEWVFIRGLPQNCSERDIFDLFSEVGVTPMQISFVHDNMGFTGRDAYCRFESNDVADKACSKNDTSMGRYILTVKKVSREEAERNVVSLSGPPPGMEPWNHQGFRNQLPPMSGTMPFMNRMNNNMPNDSPPGQSPNSWQPSDERFKSPKESGFNSMEPPRFKDPRAESQFTRSNRGRQDSRGGRGGMMGNNNNPHNMGGNNPSLNPMNGPNKPRMPPRRDNNNSQQNRGNKDHPPYIDGDTLENFGRPGCVVSLENIHFKADIDEIMDFFAGFSLEHEDVIRRFDDKGRPTGDARVCLKSPMEAMRAVKELNYRHIRARSVRVTLLQ